MDKIQQAIFDQFGQEAADYYAANFNSDDMFPFDGQNCDEILEDGDICPGWDGLSKRCCCDNRRVTWVWENSILYAEAY